MESMQQTLLYNFTSVHCDPTTLLQCGKKDTHNMLLQFWSKIEIVYFVVRKTNPLCGLYH